MTRLLLVALLALAATTAHAQTTSIDVGALDTYFQEEAKVEVNLKGSLLRLLVEASREDEPEFAEMISGLTAVTVRVYPLASAGNDLIPELGRLGDTLEDAGWSTLLRVRGDDEDPGDVWIYVLDDGEVFNGLTVMATDPEEDDAAFVVIDGQIDPAQIGRLSSRFGGVDLNEVGQ
ncbi:MAG: DUF4252 domain-containing protein [Bacteroidota bacterium]